MKFAKITSMILAINLVDATAVTVYATATASSSASQACPVPTPMERKIQRTLARTAAGRAMKKQLPGMIMKSENQDKALTVGLEVCHAKNKAVTDAEKDQADKDGGACFLEAIRLKENEGGLQRLRCQEAKNSGSDSESSDDEERHHSDNNKPIFIDGQECPVIPAADQKAVRAFQRTSQYKKMNRRLDKELPGMIMKAEAQIKEDTVGLNVCHAKNKAVTAAKKYDMDNTYGRACYNQAQQLKQQTQILQALRCAEAQNKQQSEHHGHHYSTSWRVNWRSVGWAAISCITVGGGVVATTKMMATFNENQDDLYHVDQETA